MKGRAPIWIAFTALSVSAADALGPEIGPAKKIIKTGQDMPNARYLRTHIRQMEQYGFDGVTIDLDTPDGDGRSRLAYRWWAPEEIGRKRVQDSMADLAATEFRRFTHNFVWVSTQSQPLPAPAWSDDGAFAKITANMVLAAEIVATCRLKGVFLDVEQYGGMAWSPWMMRFNYAYAHANGPGMLKRGLIDTLPAWEEQEAAARRRGRDIASAMCRVCPDITIFVLPGLHRVARNGVGRGNRWAKPPLDGLASSDYGLLAAFGDGMLQGLGPDAALVDGHERSYAYTLNKRFVAARRQIEDAADVSAVPQLYRARMKAGFGLMLDNRYNIRGGWHADPAEFAYNHFTPKEFENALYFAMLNADEYVWIWNELKAAVFFGAPPAGPSAEPNVPPAYQAALRDSRKARSMNAGRDNTKARSLPIPAPPPTRDEAATFGPLLDRYEIVGQLPSTWRFLADDESLGIGYYTAAELDVSEWDTIEIDDTCQRKGYRFRGLAWYRCRFTVPATLKEKQVVLLFGGVDTEHFFVNGAWQAERRTENGVWIVDFTKSAQFGSENVVALSMVTVGNPVGVYRPVKLAVKK